MNTTPLTPDSVLAAPTHPEQAPDAYDWRNDPQLSEKWKKRFAFHDSLPPVPTDFKALWIRPQYERDALKKLSFKDRVLVGMNLLGFFFTFIYLGFFLKLWKQALMALGLVLVLGTIGGMLNFSDNAIRSLEMGVSFWVGFRANYWYFLSKAKGKDIGWMF